MAAIRFGAKPSQARCRSPLAVRAFCLVALASPVGSVQPLDAQAVDFRFVGVDMFGGAAWVADSDVGVAFGGRLGFADLMGRKLRLGFELDWWSAQRTDSDLAVRDALGGLALWLDIGRGRSLRPFLGGGMALHWIDVSFEGGAGFPDAVSLAGEELEGLRLGASGFVGTALRLSQTGTIWLVAEYRYTGITDVPYHEARLGFRLSGSGS